MKNKTLIPILLSIFIAPVAMAQLQPELQYFRYNDQRGLNVFETPKTDTIGFDGVKVRVGGDFALQFQSISHSNGNDTIGLIDLGSNFNLPTANLNLDVQLHDGVRMHLRTYLSSKHHEEAWVKGGYIQFDRLNFIKTDFLKGFMDVATIKIGMDDFSYGDAVFRRSDNARAIYNPFVGNYIMDSFTTEAFGEVTIQKNGFLGVFGMTNGKLNQSVVVTETTENMPSFYAKLGYDDEVSDNLRLRLTGSVYVNTGKSTGTSLYGGDRAGSRYYNIMATSDIISSFDGRFNPRFNKLRAIQINPFVKFHGLEFFGVYELAENSEGLGSGMYTQLGAELIYRIGVNEKVYIGGRFNSVTGNDRDDAPDKEIQRLNVGMGWFMTHNILAKLEYVNQTYSGDGWNASRFQEGEFNGVMLEAVISF